MGRPTPLGPFLRKAVVRLHRVKSPPRVERSALRMSHRQKVHQGIDFGSYACRKQVGVGSQVDDRVEWPA